MQDIKTQAEKELADLLQENVKVSLRNLISQVQKKAKYFAKIKAEYADMQAEIDKVAAMTIEEAGVYFENKNSGGLTVSATQLANQYYITGCNGSGGN